MKTSRLTWELKVTQNSLDKTGIFSKRCRVTVSNFEFEGLSEGHDIRVFHDKHRTYTHVKVVEMLWFSEISLVNSSFHQ